MEEKKLTDEEIVKAWECHIRDGVTCGKDCPYREKDISCLGGRHARDTLDLINRQKAYIERLTEELDFYKGANRELTEKDAYLKQCADQFLADYQKAQKQVDELTDKLGKVLSGIKMDELLVAKGIEQAVKDTAKEILQELWLETEAIENDEWVREKIKEIAERKSVEVE